MVARRYTYACTLVWGGDEPTSEVDVECSYSVAWGSPETGRFGPPENYDPGSGDVIEDIKIVSVGGKPWPVDLSYGFLTPAQTHDELEEKLLADHEDEMIREAAESDQPDPDDERDRRRDDVMLYGDDE